MKIEIKKNYYKDLLFLFLFCLILNPYSFGSKSTHKKDYTKVYDAKDVVKLVHRYGPLKVLKSKDGKVRIEATVSLDVENEEDAQTIFEQFDITAKETIGELDIKTRFEVSSWNTNNNITRIKFKDGTRVKKIRNLKFDFVLFVPQVNALHLGNKYDVIDVEDDFTGDLSLTLYSGRIKLKNVSGKLNLEMKYSKGTIGNFGDGQLTLYDCDINFGNGKDVQLTSKYSKLEFGDLNNVNLKMYDDKVRMGNIKGELVVTDKYSDFVIGNFKNGRMDIYDSDFDLKSGNDLQIKSKYSKYHIDKLNSLDFELSYDDKIEINELGSLNATSKYTDYVIYNLGTSLVINSYDDKLRIGKMTGPVQKINFTGKYTDLDLDMPTDTKYSIEAKCTYGKLTYPENEFDFTYYKEKNDKLEFKGKIKGATEESPKISITSYDGKINIY